VPASRSRSTDVREVFSSRLVEDRLLALKGRLMGEGRVSGRMSDSKGKAGGRLDVVLPDNVAIVVVVVGVAEVVVVVVVLKDGLLVVAAVLAVAAVIARVKPVDREGSQMAAMCVCGCW
jgi:hypothetical protein